MQSDAAKYLFQTAISLLKQGDLQNAADLSRQLLQMEPEGPYALALAGIVAREEGDLRGALKLLERALGHMPRDPMILVNIATVNRLLGEMSASVVNYREAARAMAPQVRAHPADVNRRVEYASALESGGDLDSAIVQLKAALEINAGHHPAWLGLARLLERRNNPSEAEQAALAAMQSDDPSVRGPACVVCVRAMLRTRKYAEAISMIEAIRSQAALFDVYSAELFGLQGEALDALGQYEAAYTAFQRANEGFKAVYSTHFEKARSPLEPEFLRATAKASSHIPTLEGGHPDNVREHIFLAGFPRSGTTLLGQILGAHPDAVTLDEKDAASPILEALWRSKDPAAFVAGLNNASAAEFRKAYWSRANVHLGSAPAKPVIIDKMPLNSPFFGILGCVFPKAKFIFVVRDPRDVCLSCVQQSFDPNAATIQFWTLDGTIALYDAAMSAATAARTAIAPRVLEVRYENLVDDFEGQTRRALSFAGLEWSEAVGRYREFAMSGAIATPSARQIVEPLSSASTGKWRRYAPFERAAFDRLAPWVKSFGYDPA